MINILLVEDEVHKKDELVECLISFYGEGCDIKIVDSVRSAFLAVSERPYDLIILDMALPTFSSDDASTERGQDQALGGLEVLRALKSKGKTSYIVIITQHSEITIGGKRIKLNMAAPMLSKRYEQNVVGGVLYKYKSPANRTKLSALLRKMQ